MLLTTVTLGAVSGALAGFVGHWATGGHRDFSSLQTLEADEYEVQVDAGLYDAGPYEEALRLTATR